MAYSCCPVADRGGWSGSITQGDAVRWYKVDLQVHQNKWVPDEPITKAQRALDSNTSSYTEVRGLDGEALPGHLRPAGQRLARNPGRLDGNALRLGNPRPVGVMTPDWKSSGKIWRTGASAPRGPRSGGSIAIVTTRCRNF